jgi:hypothetical protein
LPYGPGWVDCCRRIVTVQVIRRFLRPVCTEAWIGQHEPLRSACEDSAARAAGATHSRWPAPSSRANRLETGPRVAQAVRCIPSSGESSRLHCSQSKSGGGLARASVLDFRRCPWRSCVRVGTAPNHGRCSGQLIGELKAPAAPSSCCNPVPASLYQPPCRDVTRTPLRHAGPTRSRPLRAPLAGGPSGPAGRRRRRAPAAVAARRVTVTVAARDRPGVSTWSESP